MLAHFAPSQHDLSATISLARHTLHPTSQPPFLIWPIRCQLPKLQCNIHMHSACYSTIAFPLTSCIALLFINTRPLHSSHQRMVDSTQRLQVTPNNQS